MIPPPIPANDRERLAVLHSLGILDTPPEPDFDELTQLAAEICQVPIALISLIDGDRQWFKSRVGLAAESTPREQSFCGHAIVEPDCDLFVVPDAFNDPRFYDNPLVRGAPDIRFYAGAPLISSDGWAMGTLCVIDREPRELTPGQIRTLATLRRQVVTTLELRRRVASQDQIIVDLEQARRAVEEARRTAEEATRAKTEFLSAMSHEIRTPMNAVIGMTTLLRATTLTDEQRDSVATIHTSGEHLLTVINDILDLSRIEADRLVIEHVPFAVAECVATAVSLLATRAREKKIALRSEVDSSVPAVVAGDPTRVRQILVNLLSNAVKFTDHGEIVLRATGQPLPDGGTELTFSVRDTGIGVPPDRLDRLFQRFSQVDDSTSRRYGGSGLGLFISRRLAELHGGRMGVESTPGVGSNFHFTIRTRPAVARAAPTLPAVSEFDPAFASRHPARILVAEDNPVNQKVLVRLLQKLGYQPAVAGDGHAALAELRKSDYDVVLMDVEMPGLDGPATTRALRAEFPGARQPVVVAVTAHALAGNREEFLAAGMDTYLAKPIRLEELTRLLGRLPGLRRQ